jgi:hypothetical protein
MNTKELTSRTTIFSSAVVSALLAAAVAGFAVNDVKASQLQSEPTFVSSTTSTTPRPWSYDWPLKPFAVQHPVRGFFNDPRIGEHGSRAFHFGTDISAPDGTPVYAVEAGIVHRNHGEIAVSALDGSHSFGYWHLDLVVHHRQLVRRHQLLGWIGKGWGHVHFAERRGGAYVNPLRPGGIGPYNDHTIPTIPTVSLSADAIVVQAYDAQSPIVPGEWAGEPVTPALIRWRVVNTHGTGNWNVAIDSRSTLLPESRFDAVYAPATQQNHKGVPGCFSFYLAKGSAARAVLATALAVQVEASDTTGNRVVVAEPVGA